ncbi:MAG: MBL fold metallo-hydrolase [Coriobacteriia bacterium]|nr:MBL fold metallo-hydrolase [Coriobacteriia bacterium]
MRIRFEEGLVEAWPGENERKIIDSYQLLPQARPVKPRLSASVLLVRDAEAPAVAGERNHSYRIGGIDPDGNRAPSEYPDNFPQSQNIEVFMLGRASTMAFAPNAVVFPGGGVDKRDATPNLPWFGPSPAEWAAFMNCPEDDARLAIVAAAREVFEEAGVLLAGSDGTDTVSTAAHPEKWNKLRGSLARHEISFAEVLIENKLMLRTDLLGLVSNLQTPQNEPRRYDTYFFSALMPEGQQADGNTSEATIADWTTPARVLAQADAGAWKLMPPTLINLTRLAQASDAKSFVQTRRRVSKCTFHVEYEDELGERPVLRWRESDELAGCRSDYDAAGEYVPPQGFIADSKDWQGGWVHSRIYCHLNANPSPMTYTGTNTWIVLGPSPEFAAADSFGAAARFKRSCVVVDPGVAEEVPAIIEWCKGRNLHIAAVLTTHYHADHTSGAASLAREAGAPWFFWPTEEAGAQAAEVERAEAAGVAEGSGGAQVAGEKADLRLVDSTRAAQAAEASESPLRRIPLEEGALVPGKTESWQAGLPTIEVLHTPGHSPDSVSFVVEGTMHAITGDLLFSQGPTVLKKPDGNLADYLESLDKVQHLVRDAKAKVLLPAHGVPVRQCHRIINATRDHRLSRLAQIKAALEEGVSPTPEAIVDHVYKGLDEGLRAPALASAAFQLEYLGF